MKKNRIAQLLAVLLCAMLLMSVVGCKTSEPAKTAEEPATEAPVASANETVPLVISTGTLDGKFSPFFATSAYDTSIADLTQLLLIFLDKTGTPVAGDEYPCLASSFTQEVSDDKATTTYKIFLKNGVTFSDGQPVTVKDVLFSLYTLCDPLYDGSTTLYNLKIQGLPEYRLQTSAETAQEVEAILAAGFTLDDKNAIVLPTIENVPADKVAAFWAPLAELGPAFAQEIIDYVVTNLGDDTNAAALDPTLTWAAFDTPSKQAAYGMAQWNLGILDAATMSFTDASGKVWDLNTQDFTAADAWYSIIKKYNFDVVAAQVEGAGAVNLKDGVVSAYINAYGKIEGGVASISGVTSGKEAGTDGVEREYIQIVMNGVDPTAIFKMAFYASPLHYYTEGFTGTLNEFGVSTKRPGVH